MRKAIATALVASTFALTGCGAVDSVLGPSCQDFIEASENEKQEMVLDWMKENDMVSEDTTLTDQGTGLAPVGFEVMNFVSQFQTECADGSNTTRLNDYTPF